MATGTKKGKPGKKVVYVSVTAKFQSGSDRSYHATVRNMSKRREVEAVLSERGEMARSFEDAGIHVRYVPMLPVLRAPGLMYRLKFLLQTFVAVPALMKAFRESGAEIIHVNQTHEIHPLLAARLCRGKKVVVHTRGTVGGRWFSRMIGLVASRLADRVICVSNAIAAQCYTPAELASPKFTIIHGGQGLDLDVFDPAKFPKKFRDDKRKESAGGDGGFVIGMVSKFVSNRGHDLLVAAAAMVREKAPELDVRYLIVGGMVEGDEEYYNAVLKSIKDNGLENRFFLAGAQKSVSEFTAIFDLLVHLPKEWDSFPTVILEAMALEKPVVAHRLGGIPEQVQDGVTGWLFNIGDIEFLSEKIIELVLHPEKGRAAGLEGRKKLLANFSMEAYLNRVEEVYASLEKERM